MRTHPGLHAPPVRRKERIVGVRSKKKPLSRRGPVHREIGAMIAVEITHHRTRDAHSFGDLCGWVAQYSGGVVRVHDEVVGLAIREATDLKARPVAGIDAEWVISRSVAVINRVTRHGCVGACVPRQRDTCRFRGRRNNHKQERDDGCSPEPLRR